MAKRLSDEEIKSQIPLIISLLKEGMSEKNIAENMGISYATFKRKKAQIKELKEAIEEFDYSRNKEVEEALFKCCKGYHYWEEVATKVKEEYEGQDGQVLVREDIKISNVKKYKGPDLNAQKYWLNNKKSAHWKDDPNKVKNDRAVINLKKKDVELKEKDINLKEQALNKEW